MMQAVFRIRLYFKRLLKLVNVVENDAREVSVGRARSYARQIIWRYRENKHVMLAMTSWESVSSSLAAVSMPFFDSKSRSSQTFRTFGSVNRVKEVQVIDMVIMSSITSERALRESEDV